jgi:dimethylargininase
MNLEHALLRPPPPSFERGLTTVDEGPPDFERALRQHQGYVTALESCGLSVSVLSADEDYPDSCFVEDTAVLTPRGAIATRPGAASRQGEVESVAAALRVWYPELARIMPPGTVDGGDVCEADGHYLIGLSRRTNDEGARQLAAWLADLGYPSDTIDIRGNRRLLHLKSGLAYLGAGRMVRTSDLRAEQALLPYDQMVVPDVERYAANCLAVNGKLLIAAGYPQFTEMLDRQGYPLIAIEMSEFRRMDGGLSCLSLRF